MAAVREVLEVVATVSCPWFVGAVLEFLVAIEASTEVEALVGLRLAAPLVDLQTTAKWPFLPHL